MTVILARDLTDPVRPRDQHVTSRDVSHPFGVSHIGSRSSDMGAQRAPLCQHFFSGVCLPVAWQPYCLHVSVLLSPPLYCLDPVFCSIASRASRQSSLLFITGLISSSFLQESVQTLVWLLSPLRISNCACCGTECN
jgi:hypothetical protein